MIRSKTTGKYHHSIGNWFSTELACGHWVSLQGWVGSFRLPKTSQCRICQPREKAKRKAL